MRTKTTTALTALAAIPLALVLMTGCSSGSPSADPSADSTSKSKYEGLDDWQLAYAQCMRAEGIDMPDPEENGRQAATMVGDEEVMKAASEKCTEKLGKAPAAPGGNKSREQAMEEGLQIAQCFRDAGYDVPDPKDGAFGLPEGVTPEVMEKCFPGTTTSGAEG